MRRRTLLALAIPLAVLLAVSLVTACDDVGPDHPCTDVPAGGCPLAHGVSCEDPACEAVYACLPGNEWELRERCPPRPPGAEGGATPDAESGAPSFDAAVDAPPGAYGGPGCAPLLEPDCPLGVALACGGSCCGCEDLFVCANGGWDYWGSCTTDGPVPAK